MTPPGLVDRLERRLAGRAAAVVVGSLTGLLIWWLWGSLHPEPWVYDEAAYLLQARIFATGHWVVPGPPLPEFFEQFHVLVTPGLVPKYPPGHALLMVPGIWLGLPALMPLLMSAVTGALVFAIGRRLGNPWTGLIAWLVWITAPEELYLRPSYMSQVSSTLVWLLAWIWVVRWRNDGRLRFLVGFSLAAAVGALIRPVSALALALVPAMWILRRAAAQGRLRHLALAIAAGIPVVALMPWWSVATTGQPFPTPYAYYSRVYAPWNMVGFQVDSTPPLRAPTPALRKFRDEWLPVHRAHRLNRLPAIVAERLEGVAVTFFGEPGWRWALAGAFLVGLMVAPAQLRAALGAGGLLFVSYLSMAARPRWTVYYLEAFPVIAMVTAVGVARIAEGFAGLLRRTLPGRRAPAPGWLVLGGLLVAGPGLVDRLLAAREQQVDLRLVQTDLARAIDSIPGRAVIFVATGPVHRPYESYTRNDPDPARARVWVVQDRGPDNERLLRLAPDRRAYLFDPGRGTLVPWRSPAD